MDAVELGHEYSGLFPETDTSNIADHVVKMLFIWDVT
jgi:hypothetical protein